MKRPFPFFSFANFCQKKAISGLIRLIFEAHQETPSIVKRCIFVRVHVRAHWIPDVDMNMLINQVNNGSICKHVCLSTPCAEKSILICADVDIHIHRCTSTNTNTGTLTHVNRLRHV